MRLNSPSSYARFAEVMTKSGCYIESGEVARYRECNYCNHCKKNWPKTENRCHHPWCHKVLRRMPIVKTKWKLKRY